MKENIKADKARFLSKSIADFYETHGTSFSRTRLRSWGVMRLVKEMVLVGDVVVDVGAGNGRLSEVLPLNVQYVAMEPSSSLRHEAEKILANRKGVRVLPGEFPELSVKDGEANVAACLAVIHHLPTADLRRRSIHELARILKPGGRCVVTVWNLRGFRWMNLRVWLASWLRLPMVWGGGSGDVWMPWRADGVRTRRYVHAFTLREFRRLFDQREWEIERCEAWGEEGPRTIFEARNLVVVAKRR